jgi:outer membrane lipoprotein-sorting protein
VWYAGPERARVALLDTLGQSDIIRNGTDLWVWDSRDNEATHRTLPEGLGHSKAPPLDPRELPMTPEQAAEAVLAAVDPTTEVSTDGTASVAGRDAYELVLAPRDGASLISQVRLAVDAAVHLPLRVQVYGAGDDPAFEVYFTRISLERPDEEEFRFNPPPGATVTQERLVPETGPRELLGGGDGGDPRVTVIGDGWTSVLVARPAAGGADPAPDAAPGARGADEDAEAGLAALVERLPEIRGSWGSGRIMSGRLFSVLITDDGRVLVGAVTAERLTEVAADPAAALAAE